MDEMLHFLDFLGGSYTFLKGKVGDGKISKSRKGGCQFFLDAIKDYVFVKPLHKT